MKIDFHAHAFPDAFFVKLQEYYPDEVVLRNDAQGHLIGFWVGTPLPAWDHGQRVDDMNAGGVDVEILSNPSMYIRVDEHSPELCRLVNDMYADACRQSPERFKAFANLPFNHMRDALAELDRVLALPGFVGVLITSNVGGKYLHAPEFLPFWDEIPRRPSEYMPKLYFDTALGWHRPAFDCARALVGIDHLGYGSDYFMQGSQFMHWTNAFLDSLDLSKSDKEKIYSGNALPFLSM